MLSWPSAETGALPVESGVAVAFARQLREAEDPEAAPANQPPWLVAEQLPKPHLLLPWRLELVGQLQLPADLSHAPTSSIVTMAEFTNM